MRLQVALDLHVMRRLLALAQQYLTKGKGGADGVKVVVGVLDEVHPPRHYGLHAFAAFPTFLSRVGVRLRDVRRVCLCVCGIYAQGRCRPLS